MPIPIVMTVFVELAVFGLVGLVPGDFIHSKIGI